MTNIEIVCASEVEEFFYQDGEIPVSEGEMVGVEVSYSDRIDLVLFDGIYHELSEEIQ